MNFLNRFRALLKPDPKVNQSKQEFDRAYQRFMAEVRHLDPLIKEPKAKHEQH